MTTYLFDTHAWIEYFDGSQKGAKVDKLLKNEKNTIITAESTVGELCSWCLKKEKNFPLLLSIIERRSSFFTIYMNLWVEAAYLRQQIRKKRPKIGLMDSLLLAIQATNNATIVTGDSDFSSSKNILLL